MMRRKFSFYVARFLAWAEKTLHPTTVMVYRHYYARFVKEVGDLPIRKIKPYCLSAWAKTWHQSQAVVRLFRWCVEDAELLTVNPLARAKHPPKGQRCRTFTPKEECLFLRTAAKDLRTLFIAYRETMARPGELRAARVANIYPKVGRARLAKLLRAGKAFIVLHDYKNRKTRRMPNEPRVILLSPCVGDLIAKLLKHRKSDTEHIFQTVRGKPWTANALRCRMRRLRAALKLRPDSRGENLVVYTFRHSEATHASAFGIRDALLACLLGHTETATTKRYQHLQPQHLQAAMQKFWKSRQRKASA